LALKRLPKRGAPYQLAARNVRFGLFAFPLPSGLHGLELRAAPRKDCVQGFAGGYQPAGNPP